MVMVASAGASAKTAGVGRMQSGLVPFDPVTFLKPRLYLDAIREQVRRNLSAPTLVDGFNRANGSLGSAPTGQAYTVVSGTWSIASGAAKTGLTDAGAIVLFGTTLADGRISMRCRTTSTSSVPQILIRYIDANNFINVYHLAAGLRIVKRDGGVDTTLATAGAGASANVWDVIELRFAGNQIDAYLNGVLTTQATLAGADATKFGATTGIGLGRNGATSATVEYDDITVSSGASSMLLDKWSDDSGNGFDFTQATATKQPLLTWSMSATGVLVPVVRFDGVDDLMVRASIDISSALQGHVHAAIARATSATGYILTSSDEASITRHCDAMLLSGSKLDVQQRDNDTTDEVIGNTTLTLSTTPYLLDTESDSSAFSQWINAVAQTLTAVGGANNGDWFADTSARDNFVIGALKRTTEATFFGGDIHSIVLTDTTLGGNLLPLDRFNSQRYGMGITV